ncbi:M23 family metallopeptidase [Patescibacteria group bacterium]|nr:M23 family metallopeptidase [Patescibacteria group bacterium]MBU1673818.1 M23 family metallopeptidase [Patescibacteria group bacterium]MBU1964065.1 M23 family metallopeptidase [Patescibacteria group bacterium]
MKNKVLIIFLFFLFCLPASAETLTTWPVDFTEPWDDFSSPFGPRLKASESYRYDFHRGIDIPGDTSDGVHNVKDGTVFRIYTEGGPDSPYPNGGTVVIVRHNFDSTYEFHGAQTRFYSLYMHLDSVAPGLAEDDAISEGDLVGYIGQTGETDYDHLHFEIRVGTTCSLESSCPKGYDPHINPMNFLSHPENNNATGTLEREGDDYAVSVEIPRADLDLNRFWMKATSDDGFSTLTKILDFNLREGVDASTTEAIDTNEYDGILIEPSAFNASTPAEDMKVTFRNMKLTSAGTVKVIVKDVHENILYTKTVSYDDGEEPTPDVDDAQHGKIVKDEKIGYEIKLTYADETIIRINPFKGKKRFKYKITTEDKRVVVTDGKRVRAFQDGVKVSGKKLFKKVPKSKDHIRLQAKKMYKKYNSVIILSVRKKKARVAVLRLTVNNNLRKKRIKKVEVYKNLPTKLKVNTKKDRIRILVGDGINEFQRIWKLSKKGNLKLIE